MLKILHVSDTHLGYGAYSKLDPESGINLREMDVYLSFKYFVDYALDAKPDLILHAGDLFDSVRPSNRAIAFCLDQLIRLSKAGIPIVLISGNHETPRLRETGSVFKLLEHLEHVYSVYKSTYERIYIPGRDGIVVHALPHISSDEQLHINLDLFKPASADEINIGVIHAGVVGIDEFRSFEFNEQMIESGYLRTDFDYIALGHYHGFTKVEPNAYYSGSTERFSFSEAAHARKGFIELSLDKGERKISFIELPARPMVDLDPIDCSMLPGSSVTDAVVEALSAAEPAGKILRLRLDNLTTAQYHTLDYPRIRRIGRDAVHIEQMNNVRSDELVLQQEGSPRIDKLSIEFAKFIKGYPVENLDKSRLRELALDYISKEEN